MDERTIQSTRLQYGLHLFAVCSDFSKFYGGHLVTEILKQNLWECIFGETENMCVTKCHLNYFGWCHLILGVVFG